MKSQDTYQEDGVPRGYLPDGSYWTMSGDKSYVGQKCIDEEDEFECIESECLEIKRFGANIYARWIKTPLKKINGKIIKEGQKVTMRRKPLYGFNPVGDRHGYITKITESYCVVSEYNLEHTFSLKDGINIDPENLNYKVLPH